MIRHVLFTTLVVLSFVAVVGSLMFVALGGDWIVQVLANAIHLVSTPNFALDLPVK